MSREVRPGAWQDLDPARDRWLDDHRPDGVRVVPAAAVSAWMLTALRHVEPGRPSVLGNLRWLRPLRVPGGGTAFRVDLSPGRGGEVEVRLVSRRGDGTRRPFGEALIAVATSGARGDDPVPAALVRAAAAQADVPRSFHGPVFRGFSGPLLHDGSAFDACIEFAGPAPPTLPALDASGFPDARHLDALFQAAGALRTLTGAVRGVPVAVRSLEVAAGPGAPVAVDSERKAVRLMVRGRGADPRQERLDLWCGTGDGRTVLRLAGYRSAPATFATPAPVPGGETG